MGAHVTVFDLNINTLRKIDAEYGGSHRDPLLVAPRSRRCSQAGRPGDRRGPGSGRQGAQARHQCDCRADEAGCRPGGHRDRPGWLLRGLHAPPRTTTRPSTVHDAVFYCVANMPGAVPRTSTYALTNATMPYVVKLAEQGLARQHAKPTPLWPRAFRRTRVNCSPSRSPRSRSALHRSGHRAGVVVNRTTPRPRKTNDGL